MITLDSKIAVVNFLPKGSLDTSSFKSSTKVGNSIIISPFTIDNIGNEIIKNEVKDREEWELRVNKEGVDFLAGDRVEFEKRLADGKAQSTYAHEVLYRLPYPKPDYKGIEERINKWKEEVKPGDSLGSVWGVKTFYNPELENSVLFCLS